MLAERYARGEIDEEDYRRGLAVLRKESTGAQENSVPRMKGNP
ncbi:SHOCT domain-containing protein [Streptomyces sp. M19]